MTDTKADTKRPVWITGLGLLSTLGEGPNAHWDALNAGDAGTVDRETFAPYTVHALGEVDWSKQISRRDMRQMEPWQRIGTYAAGLALDDAGVKEDEELCGRMDMIVAAGGGERDIEVDGTIINEARTSGGNRHDKLLNERLSNDLRPTLFLAQLSNLLAGNISIVHKVTGSSRTFMGEEGAGISAVQTAYSRIASGQSDIVLVGGGFNGERVDMLLLFELGHLLAKGDTASVWKRLEDEAGFNQGSIGAFLVLESADHARARGAKAYGELKGVVADSGKRDAEKLNKRMEGLTSKLAPGSVDAVMSAASGAQPATAFEKTWLEAQFPDAAHRAFASRMGNGVEAQFPLGIALAALCVEQGIPFQTSDDAETAGSGAANTVLVTTLGHLRAEGLGLVTAIDDASAKRKEA